MPNDGWGERDVAARKSSEVKSDASLEEEEDWRGPKSSLLLFVSLVVAARMGKESSRDEEKDSGKAIGVEVEAGVAEEEEGLG